MREYFFSIEEVEQVIPYEEKLKVVNVLPLSSVVCPYI